VAIPVIMKVAGAAQALPPLAALRFGRRLPAARRWIVGWGLVRLLDDGIALALALQGRHNLWLRYPFGPLETALLLVALSLWHGDSVARLALRVAVPVFALTWGLLVGFVERTDTFGLVTGPLQSLVVLSAALVTLLVRVRSQEGGLLQEDWFWVCTGLSLWYGSSAALEPLSRLLVAEHPSVVSSAYQVKAVVDVLASLILARGMLCPILPLLRPSGGPSPQESSPLRYS
jgi:hypothetical protein